MRRRQLGRRLLLVGVVAVLLVLAWGALAGAVRQLPGTRTVGQGVETALQLACGVLTLLVVLTSFVARGWARAVRIGWAISLAGAAGLSALVWGPPMPWIALLFVAAASLAALAITWALRTALATDPDATS